MGRFEERFLLIKRMAWVCPQASGRLILMRLAIPGLASGVLLVTASVAGAGSVTFDRSGGGLSTAVKFQIAGTQLSLALGVASDSDVLEPAGALKAVSFGLDEGRAFGTFTSADIDSPFGESPPGNSGDGHPTEGMARGNHARSGMDQRTLSSAALEMFGLGSRLPMSEVTGRGLRDGLDHTILTAGDVKALGEGVAGGGGLIQNQMVFTLASLPKGFDPDPVIAGVRFQYAIRAPGPDPELPRRSKWRLLRGDRS
jgi:hypothetical protein